MKHKILISRQSIFSVANIQSFKGNPFFIRTSAVEVHSEKDPSNQIKQNAIHPSVQKSCQNNTSKRKNGNINASIYINRNRLVM